ncbi:4Fe-4S binding protein [Dysgonomonas sp. BGC7]|nr:4Fe-4S binding protein [Dysgonomonas sp. BGC7]MBD8387062.1 4Fe-4S binding protein [Dysgonomonas sp. BGC7]
MSSVSEYFSGLFGGIKSLLTGMRVTWGELWTKKITEQYPENRATLVIPDRFRGELIMPHDENNEHNCTACGICQMNCPNGTIKVISKSIETEEGKKKKILDRYIYDLGMCTFCNLCVITCPSDAIHFANTFENALFTRSKLIEQLNHEGSKLKEKKKEPKPVVTQPVAKAEEAVHGDNKGAEGIPQTPLEPVPAQDIKTEGNVHPELDIKRDVTTKTVPASKPESADDEKEDK